jgi:hypothetical protein
MDQGLVRSIDEDLYGNVAVAVGQLVTGDFADLDAVVIDRGLISESLLAVRV